MLSIIATSVALSVPAIAVNWNVVSNAPEGVA